MEKTVVSRVSALLPHPPERVWAAVTDLENWQWRSDLRRLDVTGDDTFTEYGRGGFPTCFTGRWTGEFSLEGSGTRVTFTETIAVKKPWMRLFVRGYLRRQQARYLADLERALERTGGI